jgi:membrane-associated phospholipid phosphatase|tara:strand:+ start:231 stop:1013 length:783 start_codon:yes stop_codon:yes gene_type:complete
MSNHKIKFIYQISSLRFFIIIATVTAFIFNFLDILIFQITKSFHGIFFIFFSTIIDPLSDFLDPFNIIVVCSLVIFLNLNVKYLLQNKIKLKLLQEKTGLEFTKIIDTFDFYLLVCKHWIWSLATAGILCNIIKYIFGVARPKYFFSEGFERVDFFNALHKANSFPSGHTQAAFTLAILLVIYVNKYYWIIFTIASLMGISRIFMSMHFPSDILFGAYLGSLVPILLYKLHYEIKMDKYKGDKMVSFGQFVKLTYWRIFI